MLRAMLLSAATGMAGAQIATGIHLQDVRFKGDQHLDGVDLKKCASNLKSQLYVGTDWIDYFVGRVQTKCLLDKGYFKSKVTASTRQLPDKNSTHQFSITFNIDAGRRQPPASDLRSPLRHEPHTGRQEALHLASVGVQAHEGSEVRPRSGVRREPAGASQRGVCGSSPQVLIRQR